MEDSLKHVSDFLTYFVPEKYIGNTKALVKENAASLKKFYRCMADHGLIKAADLDAEKEWIEEAIEDGGRSYRLIRSQCF